MMLNPPVQEEERNPVPPGYTRLMGAQPQPTHRVSAFGQPRAIDRGGAPGEFIPYGLGRQSMPVHTPLNGPTLGAVPLANPQAVRQPSIGQEVVTAPPTQPPPPDTTPSQAWKTQENGTRLTWGSFNRNDAAELAAFLGDVESRMMSLQLEPGPVREIRTKLETFVQSNVGPDAEVTISENEATQLNEALMKLETAEGAKPPSLATTAAVVAGIGLISVVLLG